MSHNEVNHAAHSGLGEKNLKSSTTTEYKGIESLSVPTTPKSGAPVDARWLPYTLRGYLVWIPTGFSLLLGVAVIILYTQSEKNNGIASTSSAVVGWQFIPTLLAIIYTQLTTMLFEDVKRTEPFARLAQHSHSIPSTSRTLLETPQLWWITLFHGFNKKRNGGKRSWSIILTCLVNVLASMCISPLSSALLSPREVAVSTPLEISRLIPKKGASLKAVDERDTYFRAMGSLLQNVITSPWISDNYTVLPFWPSQTTRLPWDDRNTDLPQLWKADTTVFRNTLKCSKLTLASKDINKKTTETKGAIASPFLATVGLESPEGCQVKLSAGVQVNLGDEVKMWYNTDFFSKKDTSPKRFDSANFDKCNGDEIIFLSSAWLNGNLSPSTNTTTEPKFLSNMTATSYICSSEHTMATIPVTASISDGTLKVDFDPEQFEKSHQLVSDKLLDIPSFKELYTKPQWYQYVVAPDGYLGLGSILGTSYNFDSGKIMNDDNLVQKASRIRGRHFGELLRTSLEDPQGSETELVSGQKVLMERRITTNFWAVIVLAVLFFSSFIMLSYITWLSRLRQRPLNLTHDPATVLGCVSLVASNPQVLTSLRHLDQSTQGELVSELKARHFHTTPGQLHEIDEHSRSTFSGSSSTKSIENTKRVPFVLKFRALTGLLFYLIALLVTIVVLHKYASDKFFHQTLFVYHVNYGESVIFVPFSIVPTLFGVLLGLCWNALDRVFRALQPYFAMSSKTPTKIADGAANSYESSYWLWASVKAAKHKHWLLSLVTLGTLAAQVFTIALSALFYQDIGYISDNVNLDRTLELRQTPHIRSVNTAYPPQFNFSNLISDRSYVGDLIKTLFTNLSTNWMYTAEIQLTMNGPEPSWSKDGWSFVPVDLSHLDNATSIDNRTQPDQKFNKVRYSAANVTLTTPAIRGRAECIRNDKVSDLNTWGTIVGKIAPRAFPPNITGAISVHNNTGRTLLKNLMFPGPTDFTPIAPDGKYISCCANQTDPARIADYTMPVAIGYWASYYYNTSQKVNSVTGTNTNFSVKWIRGEGGSPWSPSSQAIEFPKTPQFQALNCMPVVEKSEAELVVDKDTGHVQSYRLLSAAVPDDSAWSESFVIRNFTNPNDPFIREQLARKKNGTDLSVVQNITTSYGPLFLNSLLRASRKSSWSITNLQYGRPVTYEQVDDNFFNIRNNLTGLNLDFMSYASYIQAGKDADALTDTNTLINHTQRTFTTFFQHYVSSSFTTRDGGWVYQPIGTSLKDIGPPAPGVTPNLAPNGKTAVPISSLPPLNTQRKMAATMTTRVEVLRMNQTAFYVCVVIVAWLSATAMLVMALQRTYFGNMKRDVECMADVLVLIAGSDRLLALVRERGVDGLKSQGVKTRLGWFRGTDGRMRWGIEVVEDGEVLMD